MKATLLKWFYCFGLRSNTLNTPSPSSHLSSLLPFLDSFTASPPFQALSALSFISPSLLLLSTHKCFALVIPSHHWDTVWMYFIGCIMGFQCMYTMCSNQVRVITSIPTSQILIIFMWWELHTFIVISRYIKSFIKAERFQLLLPKSPF